MSAMFRLTRWRPLRRARPLAGLMLLLALAIGLPGTASAGARDQLSLLLPDGADARSWQVQVWIDSAAEEGLQIQPLSASAFMALGTAATANIGGLILPDSAHIQASDALVAAVKQYVQRGGRLMLTYDAASLNDGGFYDPAGRSRFSDLVGVDYVLDQSLRDRVVGFGPIVGTQGRLDNLSLPPGKYLPYTAASPEARAALAATPTASYVPSNRFDPGGSAAMRDWVEARAGQRPSARARFAPPPAGLRYDRGVGNATPALNQLAQQGRPLASLRRTDAVSARVTSSGSGWSETAARTTQATLAADDASLQVVSGYGFGPLSYYHFVTTGSFPGTVFLSSPAYGLVAGERDYGAGRVLFVNIPLGYFKAIGTDGVLLHGFLSHFARDQIGMPRLSAQPKGVGGLVYNWHVDDGDDIVPDMRYLMARDFMQNAGPFSVHFTAGPDSSVFGDREGMNLPANPAAQDVVRKVGKIGNYAGGPGVAHALGSHGGWNHNLYGSGADESNAAIYQPWLELNFSAIENVGGARLREYSAPMGNNPGWATQWLEARGVVGMYTVSNTGSPATREWRAGARLTSKLWSMPISPFGVSATFEDFEDNGVTDAQSTQWLIDLQSFVVNHRTNRLFYNHPPGARAHLGVVRTFVNRADQLARAGQFKWYTMTELADFSQRRIQTAWSSFPLNGSNTFVLSNPQSLADVTMLLPRSRYGQPRVRYGSATVSQDASDWVVTARDGTWLQFEASER